MFSEEHEMMSNTTFSEGTESIALDDEVLNGHNSIWTREAPMYRSSSPKANSTRRQRSPLPRAKENAPQRGRMASLPPSADNRRPKEFLTGIDYKTKFMRQLRPRDASQKVRSSSEAMKTSQQTRQDTRAPNNWRQNRPDRSILVNQPKRRSGNARHLTEARSNLPRQTVSSETTKLEVSLIQGEETGENLKLNEASLRLSLEQTSYSIVSNTSDNRRQGINEASPRTNPPNSSRSKHAGSSSLHTTPRSPRKCLPGQDHSESLQHLAAVKTLSLQTGSSRLSSEALEMQIVSSPQAQLDSSITPGSSLQKNKLVPNHANALQNAATSKQEPVTFTTQFVPLFRWTNKTNSEDLFEPCSHEGSYNRPNSAKYAGSENQDGGNAAKDDTSQGEQSKKQSKETATRSNGDAIQKKRSIKQQQTTTDEDSNTQRSSPRHIAGEGENLANVRSAKQESTTQDGTLSNDAKGNLSGNQMTPVKQVWKLTGPQQIVSGCALSSKSTTPLIKRQQSVKNIAMAKQPAAYMRSANRLVGNFAGHPKSAVNKKPIWK